jgi:hypothetical protein
LSQAIKAAIVTHAAPAVPKRRRDAVSNVDIRRAVENIGSATSVYTPIVEVIVNAIQAIESSRHKDGKVTVHVLRDKQLEMDDSLPEFHRVNGR